MSKKTLFGCESILPNFISKVNESYDNYCFNKVVDEIKITMPEIIIDRPKLEKWVNMCICLENIDKEAREELGFKMKLAQKDEQIASLENKIEEMKTMQSNLNDYYWDKVNELDKEYNEDLEERLQEIEILREKLKNRTKTLLELIIKFCEDNKYQFHKEYSLYSIFWNTKSETSKSLKEFLDNLSKKDMEELC